MMNIRIKSVYAAREPSDGFRVLVDDFLPASMNETMAGVDLWMRNISPGSGVKKLLEHVPESWDEFEEAYFRELDDQKGYLAEMLADLSREGGITLYYSTSDHEHNVAAALRDYLNTREARVSEAA